MLAKELKIQNLMQQRAFITEAIKKKFSSLDGSPEFIFAGQLFEENIAYFKHEGFKIISIEPGVVPLAKYHPLHVFLIDENAINFSYDDLDKAEKIEIRKDSDDTTTEDIESILASFLGYQDYMG